MEPYVFKINQDNQGDRSGIRVSSGNAFWRWSYDVSNSCLSKHFTDIGIRVMN